jgi:hypothetical protein
MMPGTYPLVLYRGDTAHWRFTLWLDAGKTQPADLTGATAKAEIRDQPAGAVISALDCTVELPNVVVADLTALASGTLPAKGVWDLQMTYASGDVVTILAGPVTVTPDVTDSTRAAAVAAQAQRTVRGVA